MQIFQRAKVGGMRIPAVVSGSPLATEGQFTCTKLGSVFIHIRQAIVAGWRHPPVPVPDTIPEQPIEIRERATVAPGIG